MNDKPEDAKAWVQATCDIIDSDWQFGPINLDVPSSGRNMPDVQLDVLCDIIFADMKLTSLSPQNAPAYFKTDL